MYHTYVVLSESADAWKQEIIGFLENYLFPCAAAWNDLHVYFGTKLKNHYSLKKRYLISNMGLVSYKKTLFSCFSKCSWVDS